MNIDTAARLVSIAAALVLVGSALFRRRLTRARLVQLALLWGAIIASICGAIELARHAA